MALGKFDTSELLSPRLRTLPFALIRRLSPEQFVALLAEDLGAAGVVAGRNYRFGTGESGREERGPSDGGERGPSEGGERGLSDLNGVCMEECKSTDPTKT